MRAMIETQTLPKLVLVRDVGGNHGATTVTNDAEDVVRFILEKHNWDQDVRILYEDTGGLWDELQHDGTGFLSFRIWGAERWQDIVTDPEFEKR